MLLLPSNVFAEDSIADYSQLFEQYQLETVTEIPEGVTPIVINDPSELETAIANVDNMVVSISNPNLNFDSNLRTIVTRTTSANFHTGTSLPGAKATVSLQCTFKLYSEGSFTGIDSLLSSNWVLTGTTAGIDISDSWTSHSLDRGVMVVDGETTVNLYVWVTGFIKLYSTRLVAGYKYEPIAGYSGVYSYTK
ncbi:hypothetical protein [Anaerorhabdus sp.]|uniref:hypothetical protein n=1 Tax=Anaerorhabdus sp. TaxID=1872524 RepID=UPI002FCB76B4